MYNLTQKSKSRFDKYERVVYNNSICFEKRVSERKREDAKEDAKEKE